VSLFLQQIRSFLLAILGANAPLTASSRFFDSHVMLERHRLCAKSLVQQAEAGISETDHTGVK
jgi:hypothetical protein